MRLFVHILLLIALISVPDISVSAAQEPLPPLYIKRTVSLQKGETLMSALLRTGITRETANTLVAAVGKKASLRRLQVGQKFQIFYKEREPRRPGPVMEMVFHTKGDDTVKVARVGNKYVAEKNSRALTTRQAVAVGTIRDSLYMSAKKAGLPVALVPDFANIFAYEIDFSRDIRSGAEFRVVYEEVLDEEGNYLRTGDILAAQLEARGKTREAYRGEYAKGRYDYYDAKGVSKRRMLMRTPLEFTRISSHYNLKRMHPILGYTRAHRGTDFAAPTGTPIWSAGNGTIEEIGWKGGYGKYIRVRHNGTYKTAYAHLHNYARGMRKGKKVKQGQVIGYVGSTGRSTGPHLHYEVIKNGSKVNPMRAKLPTGMPLPKGKRQQFITQVAAVQKMWAREDVQLASR